MTGSMLDEYVRLAHGVGVCICSKDSVTFPTYHDAVLPASNCVPLLLCLGACVLLQLRIHHLLISAHFLCLCVVAILPVKPVLPMSCIVCIYYMIKVHTNAIKMIKR